MFSTPHVLLNFILPHNQWLKVFISVIWLNILGFFFLDISIDPAVQPFNSRSEPSELILCEWNEVLDSPDRILAVCYLEHHHAGRNHRYPGAAAGDHHHGAAQLHSYTEGSSLDGLRDLCHSNSFHSCKSTNLECFSLCYLLREQ